MEREGIKRLKTIFSFVNASFDPTVLSEQDLDLKYLVRQLDQIKKVDPEPNFKQDVFSEVLSELNYPPASAEARESEERREKIIDYKYEDIGVGFEVKPPLTKERVRKKSYSVEDLKRHFEQVKTYIRTHGLDYVVLTDGISFLVFSKKSIRNAQQPYFTYFNFTRFEEELSDFKYQKIFDKLRRLEGQSQREPLEKSFFNALQKWISLVEMDVGDKSQAVHFINAMIFVRTLEDIEAINFNYLKNHYSMMRKDYPRAPQRAAEDFLNHIYRHIYYHYDTELFDQNTDSFRRIVSSIQYETLDALLYGVGGGAELVVYHLYEFNFALINFDVLGHVYERYIAEDKKQKGIFYTSQWMVDLIVKRALEPATSSIMEQAKKLLASFRFKDAEEEIGKLLNLKILDPACGSGTFLVTSYNFLYEQMSEFVESFNEAVLKRNQKGAANLLDDLKPQLGNWQEHLMFCLYGIDSDYRAIEVAKLNLWINLIRKEPKNRYHYARISERGASQILPDMSANLFVGDSLKTMDVEEQKQTCESSPMLLQLKKEYCDAPLSEKGRKSLSRFLETLNEVILEKNLEGHTIYPLLFPEVFESGGFDIVIGNPPYVGEEDNKELFRATKKFPIIKERGWYMGKMDYWYFFSHLALELLKDGGVHSFLVPTYWLKAYGSKNLVNHFADEGKFREMWNFRGFRVFYTLENDKYRYVGVDSLVFFYQKGKGATDYRIKYFEMPQELLEQEREKIIEGLWETILSSTDERELKIEDGKILILKAEVPKITSRTHRLADLFNVNQGIVSNPHVVSLKHKSKYGHLIKELKTGEQVFVLDENRIPKLKLSKKEKELMKPFYPAHFIEPYFLKMPHRFQVIYSTSETAPDIENFPAIKKHLKRYKPIMENRRETKEGKNKWWHLHWPRDLAIFESEKIVSVRQSPHRPRFAYVDKPAYFDLSVNVITPKSDDAFSLKALTCILNSSFARNWFDANCSKKGNTWQIDKGVLEKFPLVIPPKRVEKLLDGLHDKAVALTKELRESEAKFVRVVENLQLAKTPTSELPKVARLLKLDESDLEPEAFDNRYKLGIVDDVTLKVMGDKASAKLVFHDPLRLKNVEYSLLIFGKVYLIPRERMDFLEELRLLSEINGELKEILEKIDNAVEDLYKGNL